MSKLQYKTAPQFPLFAQFERTDDEVLAPKVSQTATKPDVPLISQVFSRNEWDYANR
jgi:hypothetical protein